MGEYGSHESDTATTGENGSGRKPGAELRAAREARNLSVEDIAAALHLSPNLIRAIEQDDYGSLPIATYVRGYLRAYCRQVDIDAEPIIDAFEQAIGEVRDPVLQPVTRIRDPMRSNAPRIAFAVLLAVVVLGTAAWWFYSQPGDPDDVSTFADEELPDLDDPMPAGTDEDRDEWTDDATVTVEAAEDEPERVEAPEPAAEVMPVEEGVDPAIAEAEAPGAVVEPVDPETVLAALADLATGPEVAAEETADEDTVAAEAPEATETEATETEATETEATETEATEATEPEVAEPEVSGPTAEEATTDAAMTGPDRLTIVVAGESWLEIHDDRGRQLVHTLYSGLAPIELRGWAPFDLFLGNSPAVTVLYDGEPVDKDRFTRTNDTARFMVDGEGAYPRPPQDDD